jgi:hypothetical protein
MNALEARFAAWKDRRACGTCTACCHVFEVPDVPTAQYEWCRHCAIGQGCRIYETRPEDCRDFHCLWRLGFGTDEDRPDRHGVVIDLERSDDPEHMVVIRIWRPRHHQERQRKSAQRMQDEIWQWFCGDLGLDPTVVCFELHGPPPTPVLRYGYTRRGGRTHARGADAADSAEWGTTRGAGRAARAAGAARATGGDDASGE